MRLHVLGVPHAQTHRDFTGCAFSMKVWKFLKMMSGRGHEIYHYGHERRDWDYPDVVHVPVITDQDHRLAYGDDYVNNQSWRANGFTQYRIDDSAYNTFTNNAVQCIRQRQQANDLVLCFFGWGHEAVARHLPDMKIIEPGIGYPGAFARWRIYESNAIMMAMYGAKSIGTCDMDFYHRVIPNYFDLEDFDYKQDKEDYVLYLGRIGENKGVDIAISATKAANVRLKIAGQGHLSALGYASTPEHVELVGYADQAERRRLLANASALFIASRYLEPFAGVQVEAWLSGTPVIAPNYAAFAELNQHGVTGYNCWTHRDFITAIENRHNITPADCRTHGLKFTLDQVAPQYERYFQDVLDTYTGKGWYQ